CAPFSGDFTINAYQLYPENADFDFNSCKLYIGQLWNASLGIYDPYTSSHTTVEFANISHNPLFHMGAVAVDQSTGLLSIIADYSMSFATEGRDIAGTNWLLKYNPANNSLVYKINLTDTSHGLYGGFQDIEHDSHGSTFIVGTFPSSLLKISPSPSASSPTVTPWYLPPSPLVPTAKGLGGIAAVPGTNILLAQGDASGALWRFDMSAETGVPVVIPVVDRSNGNGTGNGNGTAHVFPATDAIYLPPRYSSTILLVAEDSVGTSVFRSRDARWESAEYLGLIPIRGADKQAGTSVVAAVQVGSALAGDVYRVLEPFGDQGLEGPGSAGGRGAFLFESIGGAVDKLL
ncbi:hypothetical protein K491DRAFT_580917, partial [Lophiostoma macrostomum CBS 122681]